MPKRTRGLLMGVISLVVGPLVAATIAVTAEVTPVAVSTGAAGGVDRASRSVLSVGHVVAVRATEPPLPALPLNLQHAVAVPSIDIPLTIAAPVPLVVAPTPRPVPLVVAPTPTPSPSPTPRPLPSPAARSAPAGSINEIILDAASRHGVDGAWMVRIARCESGLNPRAYNPAGPWIGLFQFAPSTFRGHGGTDIYDPYQQADIAASMLAHGQAHQWPVCSLR